MEEVDCAVQVSRMECRVTVCPRAEGPGGTGPGSLRASVSSLQQARDLQGRHRVARTMAAGDFPPHKC